MLKYLLLEQGRYRIHLLSPWISPGLHYDVVVSVKNVLIYILLESFSS